MSRVADWFSEVRGEALQSWFVCVALDRLLEVSREEDLWRHSAGCFAELVSLAEADGEALMPVLVWPLEVSKLLTVRPADLVEAELERSPFEPPSLYLRNRQRSLALSIVEEYRRPLEQDLVKPPMGRVGCYYRAYRDEVAIAEGWDYYRAIYFEWYPDGLARTSSAED